MTKFIDITGQKFNKLTVIKRIEGDPYCPPLYECLCDCGNYTIARSHNLKNGSVKSCGCLRHISRGTHHASKTRLYTIWNGIKNRCYDSNNPSYNNYGARGITMCDDWKNSFLDFKNWALSNGYNENLTIERIDNNKGYNPDNCKWATKKEQSNNRRSCILYSYNGKTQNLTQWCEELGLRYKLMHDRIKKKGWSFERAISTPCDVNKRNKKYKNVKE